MDEVWDDFARVVARAYDASGVTGALEQVRARPPARKRAAWWLAWTVEQMTLAEREVDFGAMQQILAVLREVMKREEGS